MRAPFGMTHIEYEPTAAGAVALMVACLLPRPASEECRWALPELRCERLGSAAGPPSDQMVVTGQLFWGGTG